MTPLILQSPRKWAFLHWMVAGSFTGAISHLNYAYQSAGFLYFGQSFEIVIFSEAVFIL